MVGTAARTTVVNTERVHSMNKERVTAVLTVAQKLIQDSGAVMSMVGNDDPILESVYEAMGEQFPDEPGDLLTGAVLHCLMRNADASTDAAAVTDIADAVIIEYGLTAESTPEDDEIDDILMEKEVPSYYCPMVSALIECHCNGCV
jgi:hypothetical protein